MFLFLPKFLFLCLLAFLHKASQNTEFLVQIGIEVEIVGFGMFHHQQIVVQRLLGDAKNFSRLWKWVSDDLLGFLIKVTTMKWPPLINQLDDVEDGLLLGSVLASVLEIKVLVLGVVNRGLGWWFLGVLRGLRWRVWGMLMMLLFLKHIWQHLIGVFERVGLRGWGGLSLASFAGEIELGVSFLLRSNFKSYLDKAWLWDILHILQRNAELVRNLLNSTTVHKKAGAFHEVVDLGVSQREILLNKEFKDWPKENPVGIVVEDWDTWNKVLLLLILVLDDDISGWRESLFIKTLLFIKEIICIELICRLLGIGPGIKFWDWI